MDEPTAALGVQEQAKVLALIASLQAEGTALVIVSHNLQHVFQFADRVVVLRGGRNAGERSRRQTTPEEVVRMIVGAQTDEPGGYA
jgi:ABC-type sugar transport system ATPase subunit